MKALKLRPRKIKGRNLAGFLVAVAVLTGGIFGVQYLANAISITDITPNTGSVVGGQEVTIAGDFIPAPATMQQMSVEYCANGMSTYPAANNKPDTITLTDIRNEQEYRIRKLADGKCWMVDNLKLGSTTESTKLTAEDTNITADFDLPMLYTGSSSGYRSPDVPYTFVVPGTEATNYGYLYNWSAATAGETTSSISSGNAANSICPAGWRLPTSDGTWDSSGAGSEFAALNIAMLGDPNLTTASNYTDAAHQAGWLSDWDGVYSGQWATGFSDQDYTGSYWSSTVSYNLAHYLSFDSSNVYTTGSGSRHYGYAVRCVMDENYVPSPVAPVVPTVTIGEEVAQITAWSDTSITFVTPAHVAGKVDVVVSRGAEGFVLVDGYEYLDVPDVPNTSGLSHETFLTFFSGITIITALIAVLTYWRLHRDVI
jgi:uncharacterized protein (TIGR02145 family)